MVIKIIEIRLFVDGMFYKALELIVSETVSNPVFIAHARWCIIHLGRQGFSSVNWRFR